MTLQELTKEQKTLLKQSLLFKNEKSIFYSELADADSLISDEELEEEFGSTVFSPDDF